MPKLKGLLLAWLASLVGSSLLLCFSRYRLFSAIAKGAWCLWLLAPFSLIDRDRGDTYGFLAYAGFVTNTRIHTNVHTANYTLL